MIKLLEQKIDDWRFIKIIRHMLKAGYMEDWRYQQTYSGTPQGGIVSPILANIYLHMLDCKIRQAIEVFNIGRRRKRNPTYKNLQGKIRWMRKKVTRETNPERIANLKPSIKELSQQLRKMSSIDPFDSQYKRMRYARYADDFLIGIIGSKDLPFAHFGSSLPRIGSLILKNKELPMLVLSYCGQLPIWQTEDLKIL